MDILLALLALAVGFLLYSAWQLVRTRRRALPRSSSASPLGTNGEEPRRGLQRISLAEFSEILAKADDLVLIDLRPVSQNTPLPVQAPHVVRVRTHQLEEILRHLPQNRSAAFYGASDLCVFMIETSICMRGAAPLYVLRPERSRTEAA